jgi:hypothetical protein
MSLEKNIERIADALEALVRISSSGERTPYQKGPQESRGPQGPQTLGPVDTLVPPPDVVAGPVPENGEQLRLLGASIAEKMGANPKTAGNVGTFVTWVTTTLLPPYKVTKLVDVPVGDIAEAAKRLYAYAKKEGIDA